MPVGWDCHGGAFVVSDWALTGQSTCLCCIQDSVSIPCQRVLVFLVSAMLFEIWFSLCACLPACLPAGLDGWMDGWMLFLFYGGVQCAVVYIRALGVLDTPWQTQCTEAMPWSRKQTRMLDSVPA